MKTLRIIIVAMVMGLSAMSSAAADNHWMLGFEGMARSGQYRNEGHNWGLQLTTSYRMNFNKVLFVRPYAGFSYQRLSLGIPIGGPVKGPDFDTSWGFIAGGDAGARIVAGLDIHTGPVLTVPFKEYAVRGSWRFGVGYTVWKLYVSAAYELRMTKDNLYSAQYPNWVFGAHYMF